MVVRIFFGFCNMRNFSLKSFSRAAHSHDLVSFRFSMIGPVFCEAVRKEVVLFSYVSARMHTELLSGEQDSRIGPCHCSEGC